MADAELLQGLLKERGLVLLGRDKAVGKFSAVVRLNALYDILETLDTVLDKL